MTGYAAVVLAGGAARRMGGVDKPARPVGGRSMLHRVLAAVADADQRIVVGPSGPLPDGVRTTHEDPPGGGPVAATAAGLALLDPGTTTVALLAADLPLLTAAAVTELRRALDAPATEQPHAPSAGQSHAPATERPHAPAAEQSHDPATQQSHDPAAEQTPALGEPIFAVTELQRALDAPAHTMSHASAIEREHDPAADREHHPTTEREPALTPDEPTAALACYVDGDGRRQQLCAVWRLPALRTALDRLAATRGGTLDGAPVRGLLTGVAVREVSWSGSGPPPWFDCDTDEDVRRAEEWSR
ncbi:NTP transferase domain-containing protein [Micromonospora sp. C72]|uniref:NTP transferase domain-containing protein n=2 Tax=unclassified Micromonospora TaxID=2617518 RepID=UPI001B37B36F|nr:NTP transferase domain-containing protein [Micromonospora sp. C72]MBQ1043751.1 NTP transferase domain-containing protein [Micromonospora sp. C72]